MVQLEIQYFMGCPHSEEALFLIRDYNDAYPGTKIKITKIHDDNDAKKAGFRGSPTILINGEDLYDEPEPDDPRMACRLYPNGLPTMQEFENIIVTKLHRKLLKNEG